MEAYISDLRELFDGDNQSLETGSKSKRKNDDYYSRGSIKIIKKTCF